MVKEPLRKCSHCGQQGHNSRTCTNHNVVSSGNRNGNNVNNFGNGNENTGNVGKGKGHSFKLFGVNIMEGAEDTMKKSRSMGNLAAFSRGHGGGGGGGGNDVSAGGDDDRDHDHEAGYLSDGFIHNVKRKAAHERKRGIPWTEEEHRTFLAGLSKLGKGDWRGISTKFVTTRTPTQVASHAQKYFIRQQAPKDRKKRRSSVFDLPFTQTDDVAPQRHPVSSMTKPTAETSSKPIRSQVLAENNSAEILNRFPHLCLDNYPAPVRPAVAAPNYLVPYALGFPGNVQPWPMINSAGPSYLYNVPNVYGGVDNYVPVMITHPSGIPPPRTPPSSPLTKKADVGALPSDQTDGLELKIGQPRSKQGSELSSSPASGAIRVT